MEYTCMRRDEEIRQEHPLHYMELISSSEPIIGVSVSEPLSSHLNVDFICLSVCHGPTAYHKSLLALILRVCILR